MFEVKENAESIDFKVYVQPKSSGNAIVGIFRDALKIKLTAPPVDGAANKMCTTFLAKLLKIPKSMVGISAGLTNRNKTVRIECGKNISDKYKIKQDVINLSKI